MRFRFEECLERGKIVRIAIDPALAEKELREAESDLAAAERSLAQDQEKWAIIQGYYSLFHTLRSMVFRKGYREKSHRCLRYAPLRASCSPSSWIRQPRTALSTSLPACETRRFSCFLIVADGRDNC